MGLLNATHSICYLERVSIQYVEPTKISRLLLVLISVPVFILIWF